MAIVGGLVSPGVATASPEFTGYDGTHDYEYDGCDGPTAATDMCTYIGGTANIWICEVANALTASERSSGYTIETSFVHMVKDPAMAMCDNDPEGAGTYCAFGEIVVDDGMSGNETRYFYCALNNVALKDARLIGDDDSQDTLKFHFDQDSVAYDLKPDDDGNDLTTQLRGLDEDDELHGSRFADPSNKYQDNIYGADGDDVIWGHLDDDNIYGNDGDDHLNGGCGEDTIDGGVGEDVIHGGGGDDTAVTGGPDDDVIMGDDGVDVLSGDGDNDTICGGSGNGDILAGGAGDDVLWDADSSTWVGGGDTDTCGDLSAGTHYSCEDTTSLTSEPGACEADPEVAISCP